MVTVFFVRDYSGPLTSGAYVYGEVVTLEDGQAAGVIAEGAAERVTPSPLLVPMPTAEDPFQVVVVPAPPASAPVEQSAGDAPGETEKVTAAIEAVIDPVIEHATEVRATPARKRASKKAAKP